MAMTIEQINFLSIVIELYDQYVQGQKTIGRYWPERNQSKYDLSSKTYKGSKTR